MVISCWLFAVAVLHEGRSDVANNTGGNCPFCCLLVSRVLGTAALCRDAARTRRGGWRHCLFGVDGRVCHQKQTKEGRMERSTTTNLHQPSDDAENTFLTGCDFAKTGGSHVQYVHFCLLDQ
jgi:hypothetical protein